MVLLLSFVIGCALGSFLNVVIDRLSTGRQLIKGRSYCEHCKKTLKPIDLIPLLSYLFLHGRCRFCKKKFPLRLFVVELLSGLTFLALTLLVQNTTLSLFSVPFLAIILLCFIGIFFADVIYGIIPDALVVVLVVASAFFLFANHLPLLNHIFSSLGAGIFFLVLFLITKGKGMGFGDVKLSFVLGFLLGFPSIIFCLYLAFLTGAAVSIILVIWKKLHFFGGTIPFGPFLVISSIIALFFGNNFISFFFGKFF